MSKQSYGVRLIREFEATVVELTIAQQTDSERDILLKKRDRAHFMLENYIKMLERAP